MKSTSLPKFLYRYFWDIKASKLDPQKRPQYVIQRLLEIGDEKAICWLRKNFSQKQIKETLYQSRQISLRTGNFWSLLLGLKREKIKCFQKGSHRTPHAIWPY